MRVTNEEARQYVLRKEEFITGNKTMFSERCNGHGRNVYVVFSYNTHFPMYIYDYEAQQWYGNSDKYSRTTSRHQNITRPPNVAQWYDTDTMKYIDQHGIVGLVERRLAA